MAVTPITSSATAVTLAATNGSRQGIKITNTDANPLYVLLDPNGTPTTALYSFVLNTNDTWEEQDANVYRDAIKGIWSLAGSGKANVTEW